MEATARTEHRAKGVAIRGDERIKHVSKNPIAHHLVHLRYEAAAQFSLEAP
jgi:hypothetical protein